MVAARVPIPDPVSVGKYSEARRAGGRRSRNAVESEAVVSYATNREKTEPKN